MISSISNSSRVDRSAYWGYFGAAFILPILFLIGGIYSIFNGSYMLGILAILAIVPINIYFRVIMMRRCRDIGWPSWLPWVTFAALFLTSYSAIGGAIRGDMPSFGSFGLFNLFSIIDFGLMIAIGCVQSKTWTMPEYSPDDYLPSSRPVATIRTSNDGFESQRPAPVGKSISGQFSALQDAYPASSGPDELSDDSRHDKAIAQALAEYQARQAGGAAPTQAQKPEQMPAQTHSPAPPRAIGFGRKQV
jgi:uncharacterized membrane protein YhaH (DUF805 family)